MVTTAALAIAVLMPPVPQRTAGELTSIQPDGKPGVMCALKRTSVQADIDGFGAAVTVTQTFSNPSSTPIEAIYTFPLPQDAAVDQMRIQVGNRVIEGEIAKREDARRTYEAAKAAGQAAALLDQERPNIFTQSVANIMPGAEIKVQIRYVQILNFTDGQYEFSFPMTVGPRYLDKNTPDPDKVSPPIAPKGTRTGMGIDVSVNLNAGAPIREMTSVLHEIDKRAIDGRRVQVTLAKRAEIPNRDFILRYRTTATGVQPGFVSHYVQGRGGTFALLLAPPKAVAPTQVQPKEMIFVMDQSGSQSGFPIEKSKELTLKLLKKMGPRDTFNVLGFSNEVNPLWRSPAPNDPKNVAVAEKFVNGLQANGGTQLEKAITASLGAPDDPERLRIVVFNTDGYAGQEKLILDEVRKHRGQSRLFAFGIGNSVNRYLIDAMATEGRGDMEVVTLAEQADEAVERLYRRANSPVLTNVSVQADGLYELTPAHLPDVFLERPVVLLGRYDRPGPARITVTGTRGDGTPWSQTLNVTLSGRPEAPAISSLWARRRIDDIEREGHYREKPLEGEITTQERVTSLALAYGIMSQYTSFVAVEKRVVNVGGKPRTVRVPVEMADGVDYDKTVADRRLFGSTSLTRSASNLSAVRRRGGAGGGGFGGGGASAVSGGVPAAPVNQPALKVESLAEFKTNAERAETSQQRYERKVEAKLRKVKGDVAVQILLAKWDDKVVKAMEELGLKVEDKDKTLKAVFGTIDAKNLKALAQLAEVAKITALE